MALDVEGVVDDVLGLLHPGAPPPIAAVAPDVTWSVHGTTKCLAHGLRLAYLVGPDAAAVQRLFAPVSRLSYWFASSLSAAVMRDWIDSGRARRICDAIRQECIARERLAVRLLAGADVATKPGSFHAWVTLPPHWPARDFVDALRNAGVLAREAGAFAVEDGPIPNAVRLSLSSPDTLEDVAHGLGIVAKILFEKRQAVSRRAQSSSVFRI